MTNHLNISPEAKALIEKTFEWLLPKGRWMRGWGKVKSADGKYEVELDEVEFLENEAWREWEEENEWVDDSGEYQYEVITPFASGGEITNACLVGAMIYNNGGKKDEAFEEATLALNLLANPATIEEDKARYEDYGRYGSDEYNYWRDYDPEQAVDNLVCLNDSKHDKRHVMNLLRKALRIK